MRWSRTAEDYARYRAGFPPSLFERLAAVGVPLSGRAVDLGAGTGALALELAARGLEVTAVDVAEASLAQAARRAAQRGLPLDTVCAPAEDAGLASGAFDLVTAGQCWHWLDRPAASEEVRRLLRPGGRVVIAHLDWLERPGNVVATSAGLARRLGRVSLPHLDEVQLCALYGPWLEDLHAAGFVDIESFSFDVTIPYSAEAWRGRMRASALVGASLREEEVRAFDDALAARLEADFAEPLGVPHRVFVAHARAPEAP